MNFYEDIKVINKREWIILVSGILLSVGLIINYSIFFIRPQFVTIRQLNNEIAAADAKLSQYKNFGNISNEITNKKERVVGILSSYESNVKAAVMNQQNILDEFGKMTAKRIKLDGITATSTSNGPGWLITFSANYTSIDDFVILLERSFRVESLKIQRGNTYPLLGVEIIVTPLYAVVNKNAVLPNAAVSYDFTELLEKITTITGRIELKLRQLSDAPGIKKDPFSPIDPTKIKVEHEERPNITIDGISWDTQSPEVIIGDRVLRAGDKIRGVQIIRVNRDSIVVSWHSKEYTIKSR